MQNDIDAQRAKQEQAAQAQVSAELTRMMSEDKQKLKPLSKNELIRTINALLLDNYSLKMQLAQATRQVDNVGDSNETV